jgi:hypothetical protein
MAMKMSLPSPSHMSWCCAGAELFTNCICMRCPPQHVVSQASTATPQVRQEVLSGSFASAYCLLCCGTWRPAQCTHRHT